MDRRAFIATSAGAAAVYWATEWLDCYAVLTNRQPPERPSSRALIVTDTTMAESRAFAASTSASDALRIHIDHDVGTLWHATLRNWTGAICGVLRPSDCFVLQSFSMAEGRAFRALPVRLRPGQPMSAARAAVFAIDGALAAPSIVAGLDTRTKPRD